MISQAHLAPLPPSVCPVYWDHDAALRLYPLPDLIVVADQIKSFTTTYMNCTVINPVSFLCGKYIYSLLIVNCMSIVYVNLNKTAGFL